MSRVVGLETHDFDFPTSRIADGSHALIPTPGDAFTYVITRPGARDRLDWHGFGFTFGRSEGGADGFTRTRGSFRSLHRPDAPTTLRVLEEPAALTQHDRIVVGRR